LHFNGLRQLPTPLHMTIKVTQGCHLMRVDDAANGALAVFRWRGAVI
jgi:hypothetical protein